LIKLLGDHPIPETKSLTIKQLQAFVKERGLKGYSKLKKADLIELLEKNQSFKITKSKSALKEFTTQYTVRVLMAMIPIRFCLVLNKM